MQQHFLRRGTRRFALGDFSVLPASAFEDFETRTLTFGGNERGWNGPRRVITYAGPLAYEDFESGTLTSTGPTDFGWSNRRVNIVAALIAFENFETSSLTGGGADFGWSGRIVR